MEGTLVGEQGICFLNERLWRLVVLAAAGTFGATSQTEAAIYYSQDSAPGIARPAPKAETRLAKAHRHGEKKSDVVEKEQSKPQGPVIISISIAQQKLRLYDANGLYAETPISTGMPGHPTPMGVFSIIQKQKFHRSNIYSGAPMPFMQRITWSGVAMHAGVLPGHPASHGCIRMPMDFAVKMYGWTRMGARVIVAPGDVTPAAFSHPLLATLKVVPQPVAVEETKADVVAAQTPEKQTPVEASAAPAAIDAKLELRSTVGHADNVKPVADESRPVQQVKTADASGVLPATLSAGGMPDAVPISERAAQPAEAALDKQDTSTTDTSKAMAETDTSKSETNPNTTKPDEAAADEKPVSDSAEREPAKLADKEVKPAETASDQSKPEAVASEAVTPNSSAMEAPANSSPVEALKTKVESGGQSGKPADAAQAITPMPAAPPVATNNMPLKADLKSDFAKTYLGPPIKKTEQVAVFVSRKDSKLYVRQNFEPLFNVPVTIAADERPLGTHVFTAQVDSKDANLLHWSVVSLPAPPAKAANRRTEDERPSRGRRSASAAPIEPKPLPVADSPAEALDRLNLPADVMAKIYEAVSTGGSIIISDQGIAAGETGEGTDFIVSLR